MCVCVCDLVQLWFLCPSFPLSLSSLFSLPCVCKCWTIGCTGGLSTSPLPSVRFHYKQCWRWVECVCGVGGGVLLTSVGLFEWADETWIPAEFLHRKTRLLRKNCPTVDCQFYICHKECSFSSVYILFHFIYFNKIGSCQLKITKLITSLTWNVE